MSVLVKNTLSSVPLLLLLKLFFTFAIWITCICRRWCNLLLPFADVTYVLHSSGVWPVYYLPHPSELPCAGTRLMKVLSTFDAPAQQLIPTQQACLCLSVPLYFSHPPSVLFSQSVPHPLYLFLHPSLKSEEGKHTTRALFLRNKDAGTPRKTGFSSGPLFLNRVSHFAPMMLSVSA